MNNPNLLGQLNVPIVVGSGDLLGHRNPATLDGCQHLANEQIAQLERRIKELKTIRDGMPAAAPDEVYVLMYHGLLAGR